MKCHAQIKEPFQCSLCNKTCKHRNHAISHLLAHNRPENVCSECGRSFEFPSGLKAHMIIHTQERNYLCNQCGKVFPRKESLVRHMRIHKELNSDKNHTCNSCGKIFRDKSNLIHHMRKYTG